MYILLKTLNILIIALSLSFVAFDSVEPSVCG
jgi:hypothetical protein